MFGFPSDTPLHPVWFLDNWKHTVECWLKRKEMIGLNYSVWLPCDLPATVECIFVENSIHLGNISAPSCDYPVTNLTKRK